MRPHALLAALALGSLWSCDPCTGVVACTVPSRMSVQGRILDETSGRPVSGAVIDFIRTGGVVTDADSIRVFTDADGLFRITNEAREAGEVIADLVLRLPGGGGYRSPGNRFTTSTRRGEGQVLTAWSTVPRLPDLGILYRRGFPREILANVVIEFRQTGGPPVTGLTNGVYTDTSRSGGLLYLFGSQVQPLDAGDVIGDLTVKLPPPLNTVHRDMHIPVNTTFHKAAGLYLVGVGPNLEYHIEIRSRGTGERLGGIRVDFQRTGGVNIIPESWSAVTDPFGRVAFPIRALEAGVLTGTVTVIPPAPAKTYQRTGLQFPTYDSDGAILHSIMGVGPGLPYYAIIRNNGTPLQGVQVDFQRRSGIGVTPASFSRVTNDSGMVFLQAAPESEGDVVADITVHPPPPFATFVVRSVRLTALDDDPPGGRILLGDWNVAAPPTSVRSTP